MVSDFSPLVFQSVSCIWLESVLIHIQKPTAISCNKVCALFSVIVFHFLSLMCRNRVHDPLYLQDFHQSSIKNWLILLVFKYISVKSFLIIQNQKMDLSWRFVYLCMFPKYDYLLRWITFTSVNCFAQQKLIEKSI